MIPLVRDIYLNPVRPAVRVTGNQRDLETFVLPRDFQPNKTLLDTIASRLAGIETVHFMKTLVCPSGAVLFIIVKIRDRVSRSERFQLKSISPTNWISRWFSIIRINTCTEEDLSKAILYFQFAKIFFFFFHHKIYNLEKFLHSRSPEILIHRRG